MARIKGECPVCGEPITTNHEIEEGLYECPLCGELIEGEDLE